MIHLKSYPTVEKQFWQSVNWIILPISSFAFNVLYARKRVITENEERFVK